MTLPCDCCEGIQILTPQPTANRPGLAALAYRVGTHAAFLETMKARLSDLYLEITLDELDDNGQLKKLKLYPLKALRTRESNDPAIALLDAWATVADVLTFYQERIANEGYLRTATERRSILELARLVGYRLRPGVAATVYLAYTLDKDYTVEVPKGARAQSVPNPSEQMQSFETFEALKARTEWNSLQPRLTRPQRITMSNAALIDTLYLDGTATNLKAGDPLLFGFGPAVTPVLRMVEKVEPDFENKRTKVTLQLALTGDDAFQYIQFIIARYLDLDAFCLSAQNAQVALAVTALQDLQSAASLDDLAKRLAADLPALHKLDTEAQTTGVAALQNWLDGIIADLSAAVEKTPGAASELALRAAATSAKPGSTQEGIPPALANLETLVEPLSRPASLQPANSALLARDTRQALSLQRDAAPQLLTVLKPAAAEWIYPAWSNAAISPKQPVTVYALRVKAPLFGYNAGLKVTASGRTTRTAIIDPNGWTLSDATDETGTGLFLDNAYDGITAGSQSYVVIKRADSNAIAENKTLQILNVTSATTRARTAYGISSKTTALQLSQSWWNLPSNADAANTPADDFSVIRDTLVYAQSEPLTLAEELIPDDICGKQIELGELYDGLQSGRWVIVSGERTDIPNTTGVIGNELVMLAGVNQTVDATLPDDKVHSTIVLANALAYTYKRDTVTIYGNVVKATHGETKKELLGNGDGSQALQRFTLKSPPLTFVSAPTPAGAESTLAVYVNDVKWHESDSFVNLGPTDRDYITRTDDDDKTAVIFGDGKQGARLPTGAGNVTAVYRSGIGKPGNVKAGQITLLATKPLGVKQVVNPLPATGGADRESRDQARRNVPLATLALDRLVSTEDYADFARTFAGIGKASAARLSDGQRLLVHVTIAGAGDIPIDVNSDLYKNLRQALRQYGDPYLPIQVVVRELLLMIFSANIRVLPDYQWQSVEQNIRAALLDAFSFERRDLGQPIFLNEVMSRVQQVAGVAYVDVDFFGSIRENFTAVELEQLLQGNKINDPINAQLARRDEKATGPIKPILPAQLAYLTPDVPDTLILKEITQ
jgi:predicted phage baseplate assembly protein